MAKPSVPSDKLQVALDYACGAGGADCDPIKPNGSCYSPDSVIAHASYAFNSYWQKTKKNGGICGFEGTAMLISSDPSKNSYSFSLEKYVDNIDIYTLDDGFGRFFALSFHSRLIFGEDFDNLEYKLLDVKFLH